jgi:L-malate glycosyltransferase
LPSKVESMNICFIADARQRHTSVWVGFFVSRGHEVHLISPWAPRNLDSKNLHLHIIGPYPFHTRFISLPFNLYLYRRRIKQIIRDIKPDILHAHFVTDCGFWGALSGFHPLVLSAWGSDILILPQKSKIFQLQANYAMRRADLVTTSTDSMREYIQKKYKISSEKLQWISWGPDLEIFKRGYIEEGRSLKKSLDIDDDSVLVLSPRNMARLYQIDCIVKSIPQVLQKNPKAVFVFLEGSGDPVYKDELMTLVKNLNLTRSVRIISRFLNPEEMAILYNIAEVLVSIPNSDQLGVTILEGMACGDSVILSNLEVYRQLFKEGQNVFFLDNFNPQNIAEKVIFCLDHPEVKEEMYRRNFTMIDEHWNWRKNAMVMEKAYNKLLEKG